MPVDLHWPDDRTNYVLDDASPPVIIASTKHISKVPKSYTGQIYCMDDLPPQGKHDFQPMSLPDATSGVYCLYTSGTTGYPKGVVIEHRALVKRIQWLQDNYSLAANDRVINKTPYGLGISEWEYFWALPRGATLVLTKPEGHMDTAYLYSVLVQEQIRTGFFVPSELNLLLDYMHAKNLEYTTNISYLFTCGEGLKPETCEQFSFKFDARLINLYGPTESDMTYWEYPNNSMEKRITKVPIGKPISNTKVYILDEWMQPVPIGVPGQICFGTDFAARGYLNNPELTATHYV